MRPLAISLLGLALLLVPLASFALPKEPDTPEEIAVKDVVSRFILNAYAADGDIGESYAQLSTETVLTCSRADFVNIARAGRSIVRDEEVRIRGFAHVKVSDNRATLEVSARYGNRRAWFVQEAFSLVKESDGRWYIQITTDPDCHSPGEFFGLGTPVKGVRVTPAYIADPQNCEEGYPFDCIPRYPPDLDCDDIEIKNLFVRPPDPHGLDPDGDSFACNE